MCKSCSINIWSKLVSFWSFFNCIYFTNMAVSSFSWFENKTKVPVNFVTSEVHSVKLFSVILCGKVNRGHPLSTYAKFSEKLTFLTPWYAHLRVRIRGLEMLDFENILRTYLMHGPTDDYPISSQCKNDARMVLTFDLKRNSDPK